MREGGRDGGRRDGRREGGTEWERERGGEKDVEEHTGRHCCLPSVVVLCIECSKHASSSIRGASPSHCEHVDDLFCASEQESRSNTNVTC